VSALEIIGIIALWIVGTIVLIWLAMFLCFGGLFRKTDGLVAMAYAAWVAGGIAALSAASGLFAIGYFIGAGA
jgi:hypothetical protein